jgi:UDP-glucose 4-epimerase
MKKIVVTGAPGFIGRHVVRALLQENNYHLFLTGKVDPRYDSSVFSDGYEPQTFYDLDITNRDAIFDFFKDKKIDTCIHLAALVDVENSIRHPEKTMDVNVQGTINVLDACSRNHVDNFIFASSAAVYGHPVKLPISEDHRLLPISPYGKSKLIAEQYVSSYMKSNKIRNTLSLRIFNVYGEDANISVMTKFAKRLAKGLAPIIYGDGTHKRDFISIDDVVSAILLSVKAMDDRSERLSSTPSLIFNIGTGISTSIQDLCDQMIRLSGLDLRPIFKKANSKADIKASCADITKAKSILGFVPRTNLKSDLQKLLTSMVTTPV